MPVTDDVGKYAREFVSTLTDRQKTDWYAISGLDLDVTDEGIHLVAPAGSDWKTQQGWYPSVIKAIDAALDGSDPCQ